MRPGAAGDLVTVVSGPSIFLPSIFNVLFFLYSVSKRAHGVQTMGISFIAVLVVAASVYCFDSRLCFLVTAYLGPMD